jgi:hypothetical protein
MMETGSDQTNSAGDEDSRRHRQPGSEDPVGWPGGPGAPRRGQPGSRRDSYGAAGVLDVGPDGQEQGESYRGRHSQPVASGGWPARTQQPPPITRPAGTGQRPADPRQRPPDSQQRPADPRQRPPDSQQRPADTRQRPADGSWQRPGPAPGDGSWQRGGPARDDGSWQRRGPARGDRSAPGDGTSSAGTGAYRLADAPVARRTPTGWRVGDEEVSDLTSAMVLADLLAAELPAGEPPALAAERRRQEAAPPDTRQLQETVAQLEHALTVRVRVEQAIGVLAERHRLRPRQAFELLRSAARARGRRVLEVAGEVVDSASNPLLRLPDELAKPPVVRRRGRPPRRPPASE